MAGSFEDGMPVPPESQRLALLTTNEAAALLGVKPRWLELKRYEGGDAPPFIRLSSRQIRYERGALLRWINERTHSSTAEYDAVDRP